MATREQYYEDYWQQPLLEVTAYSDWKTAITRAHSATRKARTILDVGCGSGVILGGLARSDARLCGVEVSPRAIPALSARGIEAKAVDLEAGTLPYEDGSFDVVLCFDVFEHLFSPENIAREIHRVLAPNGTALLCVPNTLNAFNRLKFMLGSYVDIMDTSHHGDELFSNHIRLFSKQLYERFLSECGFAVAERHFYFPEAFTDPKAKLPPQLAKLVTVPRLPSRLPSLFALAFLYACKKR